MTDAGLLPSFRLDSQDSVREFTLMFIEGLR